MTKIKLIILTLSLFFFDNYCFSQIKIALLKYNGGGDWYANPTSLPNLAKFCNENLNTKISPEIPTVEIGSTELYKYPFIHMTGHGNVSFNSIEIKNLREYLIAGGFLHVDDNYGMDKFFRKEIQKVFPELKFIPIPFNHAIYHQKYQFPNGLPKIHNHEGKSPEGLGLFWKGRLICFYSYECDLGDGWEDIEVHNDSKESHEKALKMGANLINYVFTN